MKLVLFDDFVLGAIKGDKVVDLSAEVADIQARATGGMVNTLIAEFDVYRGRLQSAIDAADGVPLSSVRLRPPLPGPHIFDCMAGNYMENGTRAKPAPINAFHKSPSGIIGDGDAMVLPDVPATVFEGEAEIAVVFGKTVTDVSEADAMDHVFGYMNFIDGSARGLGPGANTFFMMKSRETFAPIGPYLVTKDEIPDPQQLTIKLWNNGEIRQDYNTDDMAYSIAQSVSWLSKIHTLNPGDILAMGTNHRGLHAFMDGDKIEMEVEGLGRLHIDVRDDLKRTWSRETRLERANAGHDPAHAPQLTGKYAPIEN